jgi:hypothetical protein
MTRETKLGQDTETLMVEIGTSFKTGANAASADAGVIAEF